MAYINVDEIFILDNTGLQVDQVTDLPYKDAGLTESQQAQARANIAAGGTNPNLLDNPFFTINQRNVAAGVIINANGFIADRWQATGTVGAQRNSDGTITINNTMYHKIANTVPVGKTATISALYADGTIESDTFTWSGTTTRYLGSLNAVCYTGATPQQINFTAATKDVSALKLELGSASTLANDLPPDYGEELRKCLRYYYRITGVTFLDLGAALAESATAWLLRFPLPVPMRVAPTTTTSGNFVLWNGAVGNACSGISTHTTVTPPTNPAYVAIQGTSSGMTTGNRYNIQARNQASAYIEFSADL